MRRHLPSIRDLLTCLLCMWCVFAIAGSLAHANDTPQARAELLIQESIELRRAGRDADAIEKLQQAYSLSPTPRAAAQLGLCLQAIGRWSDADGKLSEALTSTKDPWVRKNRDTIKNSLEIVKSHVGRIEVIGEPVGAELLINGKASGVLPLKSAVTVNEGLVDVELVAKGYRRSTRSLTIVGGGYQQLVLRLEFEVVSISPPNSAPSPSTEASTSLLATNETSSPKDESVLVKPWFWGVAAGVVAVAIVGAVVLSRGDSAPTYDVTGELK